MSAVQSNLRTVLDQMSAAQKRYRKQTEKVELIAVSKTRTADEIRQAVVAGLNAFAENYCQEAIKKMASLHDLDITWHFIGPIQSNKTKLIADAFSWVHSVDNFRIAKRLSDHRNPAVPLCVCLQVNIDNEATKQGVSLSQLPSLAQQVSELPGIKLRGLMCIPQPRQDFEEQRQPFAKLHRAFEQLREQGFDLDTLSMGMSDDFEAAIAEGSTMVRIGTRIFGTRQIPKGK